MASTSRRTAIATLLGAGLSAGLGAGVFAQRHPFRFHDDIGVKRLTLVPAETHGGVNQVSTRIVGDKRLVASNGIPDHAVGGFPNHANPNPIKAQSYRFRMPLHPKFDTIAHDVRMANFGVAVNGVPFDPGAAEFWLGDPRTGWQYEALAGTVPLGLDANYGHVQPNGAYHYHGLPIGLLRNLGWSASKPSPLVGWAADGFPIYAVTAEFGGRVIQMASSYRLKEGRRPGGGDGPGGAYDGTFVEDFIYDQGTGSLDECNGTFVETAEFPQGTYAYFLTTAFPVIPRKFKGVADGSFFKRP